MNNRDNKSVEFIFSEINFFIEIFSENNNDKTGLMIAKDINRFLNTGGNYESIIDFLAELENYSVGSNSEDFVWELVYARRFIVDALSEIPEKSACTVESALKSAKHFETICEIEHSAYNQCCRILEYLNFGDLLKKPDENDMHKNQLIENFNYCERLFKDIPVSQDRIYAKTGFNLYHRKYDFLLKIKDEKNEMPYVLTSLIRYSRDFFNIDNSEVHILGIMAVAYTDFLEYSEFSFEKEKENIRDLLNKIDEVKKENLKLGIFSVWLEMGLKKKKYFFTSD